MRKHGLKKHRLYRIWGGMKTRCYNPKTNNFKDYGGRGIIVCDEWKDDFLTFYNWAINHPTYKPGLSIERKDVNGNYDPDNCEWIPKGDQAKNTREVIRITAFGETDIVSEIYRKFCTADITLTAFFYRIHGGIPPEEALTKPPNDLVTVNGFTGTRNAIIKKFGWTTRSTTIKRINIFGWSTCEAIFSKGQDRRIPLDDVKRKLKHWHNDQERLGKPH